MKLKYKRVQDRISLTTLKPTWLLLRAVAESAHKPSTTAIPTY